MLVISQYGGRIIKGPLMDPQTVTVNQNSKLTEINGSVRFHMDLKQDACVEGVL